MNVTIRPLVEEDAYTSVKWRNDSEVFKFTGNTYKHEIKIENELEWIRKVMANPADYRCAILADDVYVEMMSKQVDKMKVQLKGLQSNIELAEKMIVERQAVRN